jgi:uncharacterized repeat protein (TIGR01451 family)
VKPNSTTAFLRAYRLWILLLSAFLLASGATSALAQAQADLAVTKIVDNQTPNVGDKVTFTITVTNNSAANAATSVQLTDLLPVGLTLFSATPSQGNYTGGLWDVGTLSPGSGATLSVTATVVSASAQTNTAQITHSDQVDPNTNNDSASVTVTPQQADLSLAKTVSNSTPNVGDTITFTVTLTNNGPDAATNVSLSDALPAGLQFVSATPSQGVYGSSTWTVGTVTPGSPQTLQIQATVVSASTQTNTASVSHSDQFDPNSNNNAASASETPQQADLALTKTVSNATPNVGDTITFTVTLTDNGPDAATNVTVNDALPPGLQFVSALPSQGTYNSVGGAWNVGTVTPGTPQTLQIQSKVVSATAQMNTATITHSDQFDPNATNNSANVTETPQQADLSVTKVVDNPAPNFGANVTFTINVANNGPDAATNVTLNDLLPGGLTFVSATPSQGNYSSATGVWNIGTVVASATVSLTITATVTGATPAINTASVTHSDQFDPNTANNTASATVTVPVDLAVTKTVSNATPNVGDVVTFTVTLTDNSASGATGVTLTDLLPSGLTFQSATPSQGTYDPVSGLWNVGTVVPGTPQTLVVQAKVVSATAQTNTAAITHSDAPDTNPGNNSASVTETPQRADLAVAKTVDNATPNVGDTLTFTITLTDIGPNAATNVAVTDSLPAGLTFVSATPSQGTYNSGNGAWTVGTVAPGTPQTLSILAAVASLPVTNTASITHSDQFDPDTSNNTASATSVAQQADLGVTKTVSNAAPVIGSTITFTVTVSNAGPGTATNVTLSDLLPSGLTFVSATPSQGSYNSATGAWIVGSVAPSSSATLVIAAQLTVPAPVTNTATITHADQLDPNTANNQASVTVAPAAAQVRPAPVNAPWMLALMVLLLAMAGMTFARRQNRA